jgi:hypothetical protein
MSKQNDGKIVVWTEAKRFGFVLEYYSSGNQDPNGFLKMLKSERNVEIKYTTFMKWKRTYDAKIVNDAVQPKSLIRHSDAFIKQFLVDQQRSLITYEKFCSLNSVNHATAVRWIYDHFLKTKNFNFTYRKLKQEREFPVKFCTYKKTSFHGVVWGEKMNIINNELISRSVIGCKDLVVNKSKHSKRSLYAIKDLKYDNHSDDCNFICIYSNYVMIHDHILDYLDIQNSSYAFKYGNCYTTIKDLNDMKSISYGIFINDPLDNNKVNCVLKISKDVKFTNEYFI